MVNAIGANSVNADKVSTSRINTVDTDKASANSVNRINTVNSVSNDRFSANKFNTCKVSVNRVHRGNVLISSKAFMSRLRASACCHKASQTPGKMEQ